MTSQTDTREFAGGTILLVGLTGVLLGILISLLAPAQAHHNDYALKRRVALLESRTSGLESFLEECFSVYGVSQYGDFLGWDGFEEFTTTGLDFDDSGLPHIWVMAAEDSCVGSGSASSDRVLKKANAAKDGKKIHK
jgi:hypothetical protein